MNLVDNQPNKITYKERKFIFVYAVSLLLAFSPSKAIGQISPLITIALLLFFVNIRFQYHIAKLFLVGLILGIVGSIYYFINSEFSFLTFSIWMITFSSFLILIMDFRQVATFKVLKIMEKITLVILMIESLYGLLQGIVAGIRKGTFDIATGDHVRGTIEPGFNFTPSGSNPIFVILLSTLLIFSIAIISKNEKLSKGKLLTYLAVILTWVLASVLHTLIFFSIALVSAMILTTLLKFPKINSRIFGFTFIFLISMVILLPWILPKNLQTVIPFAQRTLQFSSDSPSLKTRTTYNTIFELPKFAPYQPIIGLGPGQYSSRAALIASGEYLRENLPIQYTNSFTQHFILDVFIPVRNTSIGSTYFPFYSWLTIYGELGLIGVLLSFFVFIYFLLFFVKNRSENFPRMQLAMIMLMIYTFLLGVQDNYWEFTQAIFPAIFILSLLHSYLQNEKDKKKSFSATL